MVLDDLPLGDASGEALLAQLAGGDPGIVIERDDGFIDVDRSDYFADVEADPAWPSLQDRLGDSVVDVDVGAGDNPDRLRNERSFAALCAASPVAASSGKTKRHRLNRGGDRQANSALWSIVRTRMSNHKPTRAYVERRTADGLSKREIMRCLKRYVARELYPLIQAITDEHTDSEVIATAA